MNTGAPGTCGQFLPDALSPAAGLVDEALSAAKRSLRQAFAERRRSIPPDQAVRAGEAVRRLLEAWEAFRTAPRVALYAALPDELPSRPCFEAVIASGRPALLPRVEASGRLVFHPVTRWSALEPGPYGVLSPPTGPSPAPPAGADLVLVPGVAFDAAGWRLGRGGGCYDRAFPDRPGGPLLCGVGYGFQQVKAVPHGSHDRRMDAIVSEHGLIEAREQG